MTTVILLTMKQVCMRSSNSFGVRVRDKERRRPGPGEGEERKTSKRSLWYLASAFSAARAESGAAGVNDVEGTSGPYGGGYIPSNSCAGERPAPYGPRESATRTLPGEDGTRASRAEAASATALRIKTTASSREYSACLKVSKEHWYLWHLCVVIMILISGDNCGVR